MELLPPNSVQNPEYTETSISRFTGEVRTQLVSAMEDRLYTQRLPGIILNTTQVQCSGYLPIQMNTARQVLAILTVVVSEYPSHELLQRGVIVMPAEAPIMKQVPKSEGGDLFGHFALTSKQYYLFLAYNILTHKLSERDTHLFRVLYMLVCLEIWRENIPGELIAGPIGKGVHWGNVILKMADEVSGKFKVEFIENGYPVFAQKLLGWIKDVKTKEDIQKRRNSGTDFSGRYISELMQAPKTLQ